MDTFNPINEAIKIAGSASSLARMLSVTPNAVLKYRNAWDAGKVNAVPAVRAIQIERAVGVSRHLLRPDLWNEAEATDVAQTDVARAA